MSRKCNPNDIVGQKIGRLLIVCPEIRQNERGRVIYYKCLCDCGNYTSVYRSSLRDQSQVSCGCYNDERKRSRHTHREGGTRLHRIWSGMLSRCRNSNSDFYGNYKGRGISVHPAWESYIAFKDWALSNGYSSGLTLERKDYNGNYNPDNCEWITLEKQSRNRRKPSNNSSGITGVHCYKGIAWIAQWYDLKKRKRKSKYFNIKKYGDDRAFELACEAREKAIYELNLQGAGYSESHGK